MFRFTPTPVTILSSTIVVSSNLLQLIGKGKDVTKKDAATSAAVTTLQVASILAMDKFVQTIVQRKFLVPLVAVQVGVAAAYVGGAVASTLIDKESGFEKYNEFIDIATDPEKLDTTTYLTLWSLNTIFEYYSGGGKKDTRGGEEKRLFF